MLFRLFLTTLLSVLLTACPSSGSEDSDSSKQDASVVDTLTVDDASNPADSAAADGLGKDTGTEDTGGLPDAAPVDIGPPEADDDNDALSNGQEAIIGTDPNDPDTDKDGYLDGHEVMEGKDPLDPESKIYTGGWPYNPNKDDEDSPDWEKCPSGECIGVGSCDIADKDNDDSDWIDPEGCSLKNGLKLPRWTATDQYGETVDLYDLIGHGKKVILDVATIGCKPCKAMAAWFSTGDTSATTESAPVALVDHGWWQDKFEAVLPMINSGEIIWVTVVWSSCSLSGEATVNAQVSGWHEEWPHPKVIVLADPECKLKDYLNVKAMPHIDVLDENLVFETYSTSGPMDGMNALVAP